MLQPNPYQSPLTEGEPPVPVRGSSLKWVRTVFYLHLAAVALIVVLMSSGPRQVHWPAAAVVLMWAISLPLFVSWMLFPIAMAIAALELRGRSIAFRIAIIAGDLLLSGFQVWAMLPAVQ